MSALRISAVIPVYNEEEVIEEFSNRLLESLRKMTEDYEVVFVVEGDDSTMTKLREFSTLYPNMRLDYNQKRLGLGKAMKRGLSLVSHRADYVLTMDADLNHQPEEISRLLEAASEADIIVGRRSLDHGMVEELPLFKRVVSGTTNWLLRRAFQIPSRDVTSGFRLYSARAVETIRDELTSTNFEVTAELLIRAKKKGLTIADVPITFKARPRGNSKLSFVRSGIGYVKLLARLLRS